MQQHQPPKRKAGDDLNQEPTKKPKHEFRVAVSNNNIDEVKRLLTIGNVDLNIKNATIRSAAKHGHVEILKLLLLDPRVNPAYTNPENDESDALILAIENEHVNVVKVLLSDWRVFPGGCDNTAIQLACAGGNIDIVNLLLADERVEAADDENEALVVAAEFGYAEIVRALLNCPEVDPTAQDYFAIKLAAKNDNLDVVELLLSDPRVDLEARDDEAVRVASYLLKQKSISQYKKTEAALFCNRFGLFSDIAKKMNPDSGLGAMSKQLASNLAEDITSTWHSSHQRTI